MINVGFTGTRHGMSPGQIEAVTMVVDRLARADRITARHGDCVGADEDFHEIVTSFQAVVIVHPGPVRSMRAGCVGCEIRSPAAFLERNRAIVDASDAVIATPFEASHRDHGGTWYTADYALKQSKPLALVLPRRGGVVIEFSGGWAWPCLPRCTRKEET